MEELVYVTYLRKSEEDAGKQIQSIGDQSGECQRIEVTRGLNSIREFCESRSAKAPGRPIFNEMMAMIERGEANGIICWKLDRLARNPIDAGTISWLLQEGKIKSIQTYDKEYKSGDNILAMTVELGQANQFIRDMVPNVRRGMQSKRIKGHYPHAAPPGYLNDMMKPKGERDIIKDSNRYELLKRMLALVLTRTYTPAEVLRKGNGEWGFTTYKRRKTGGGPMSSSTWYRVLTNPFYCGYWEEKGVRYNGAHEPMITEDQYWEIQAILGKRGRKRPRIHEFPFTGLIKCGECGYFVTAEAKKHKISKKTGKPFNYYRCGHKNPNHKCTQKAIEVYDLEKQVDEYITKIYMTERVKQWCLNKLAKENKEEIAINTKALASLNKQKEDNQRKLYNLNTALIEERIVGNDYDQRKAQLESEEARINNDLKQVDERALHWFEQTRKTFDFCCRIQYWFNHGSTYEKKVILSTIGSNLILLDKKLDIKPGELFVEIEECVKTNDWRAWRELNPRPNAPQAFALSTELQAHIQVIRNRLQVTISKLSNFLLVSSFVIVRSSTSG